MTDFLKDCAEFIKENVPGVIRIAEFCGGETQTYDFIETNPCQNVYSVSKVFTMTAAGVLYDRGILDLDEKICDILEEYMPEEYDGRFHDATVKMAIEHSLGFPGHYLDIDAVHSSVFGKDYIRYALSGRLEYAPGTKSVYSDSSYYFLSRVVSAKTGKRLDRFLWDKILFELGFREFAWACCPMGYSNGATGLYVTAEDTAKFGSLYLNGGMYNGKRILSQEWTGMAVREGFSFGYDSTHTVYSKGGIHGQSIVVAPSQGRTVAIQSYNADAGAVIDFIAKY